jgi:hypothetical protein
MLRQIRTVTRQGRAGQTDRQAREPQVLLKHPSNCQSGLRKEVPSKATIVCFPLIAGGLSPSAL